MKANGIKSTRITAEQLEALKEGDPVARMAFFVNLFFVKRENGNVYLRDKNGDVRFYSESSFFKHGRLT